MPAARILTVPQAVALPQLEHRGFFTTVAYPDGSGRTFPASGSGVLVDGSPLRPPAGPPALGQDNPSTTALVRRWRASETVEL